MPSLSSVLFSTFCKASLLFYSFMVTKFFPVCCGSHFIWILFWFAFSVSTDDPCTILTMPLFMFCSPYRLWLAVGIFLLWVMTVAVSSACMTATFWIFPVTVETLNCIFAMNPDLWDRRCSQKLEASTIALKIITVLRKFIVQILTLAEVLE